MITHSPKTISFIIPCLNEEECVKEVYQRICSIVDPLGLQFEIIFIDDGSTDKTLTLIKSIHTRDQRVKIISFSRNFGQQLSIKAGLAHTTGDCAVVMDCDMQDPPDLIPQMVARWEDGVKVVYAVRKNRKENILKRACYRLFYSVLNKISTIKVPSDVGDFCLMDRQVINEINKINELQPFIRGLRAWVGFRQEGIEYDRPARTAGNPSYSAIKLIRLALDGFMSVSDIFLVWSGVIGVIVSFLSFMYGIWIGLSRILILLGFLSEKNLIPGWATIVCMLSFLMGLQFIYFGLLGKYIGRLFMQAKSRPLYIIDERIGFSEEWRPPSA